MYIHRCVETEIERKLKTSGAVLVSGPKFCGKTTTCMLFQKSMLKLNTAQSISLAKLDPDSALDGDKPRMIDEWQTAPALWDHIKDRLDQNYVFGSYILTGSATPADKTEIHHSGAGRITNVTMRPMTLYESGDSNGYVSLKKLFDEESTISANENSGYSLYNTARLLCRGGWPISVIADQSIAIEVTKNYCNGLFLFENSENEKFRNKKPEILRMILKSYARHISSEAPYTVMIEDVRQTNSRSMDSATFSDYLEALRDLFIIFDIQAWNPNFRSKTSIRATPTRHFTDPSIAAAILNISPADLMKDLNTFGLFFEDLVVRDLTVYSSLLGGEVRHYRDRTGLECDAVIHLEDGRWAAVEIKLGGENGINDGAASLNRLKKKITENSNQYPPVFMAVITAVGPFYRRNDGIYVIPINMLKP